MGLTARFFTVAYLLLIAALVVFGGPSDPLMKGIAFELLVSTVVVWWLRARWSGRLRPGTRPMLLIIIGILCSLPAVVVLGRLLY